MKTNPLQNKRSERSGLELGSDRGRERGRWRWVGYPYRYRRESAAGKSRHSITTKGKEGSFVIEINSRSFLSEIKSSETTSYTVTASSGPRRRFSRATARSTFWKTIFYDGQTQKKGQVKQNMHHDYVEGGWDRTIRYPHFQSRRAKIEVKERRNGGNE